MWERLHEVLLVKLQRSELIDWSRAAIDSSHVRAVGGRENGAEPRGSGPPRFQAPSDHLWGR